MSPHGQQLARSRTLLERTGSVAPLQSPFPKTGRKFNKKVHGARIVIDRGLAPGKIAWWSRYDRNATGTLMTTPLAGAPRRKGTVAVAPAYPRSVADAFGWLAGGVLGHADLGRDVLTED